MIQVTFWILFFVAFICNTDLSAQTKKKKIVHKNRSGKIIGRSRTDESKTADGDASGNADGNDVEQQYPTTYDDHGNVNYYRPNNNLNGYSTQEENKTTYQDQHGNTNGFTTQQKNKTVTRNKYGNTTGSIERKGNNATYRDKNGNRTGTSTQVGNTITYRDKNGNIIGTSKVQH